MREAPFRAISIGTILAVVLSFGKWHSILWAVIHGFFGWGYVVFYLLTIGH